MESDHSNNPPEITQELEEQVTPETLEQMNRVFVQASHLLKSFTTESTQLRGEITGLFKNYNQSSTEMIPQDQIRNITQSYQQGMREVQRENHELQQTLKKEFEERDQLINEMNKCFQKLDSLEEKVRRKMQKKRKEQEAKNVQEIIKEIKQLDLQPKEN